MRGIQLSHDNITQYFQNTHGNAQNNIIQNNEHTATNTLKDTTDKAIEAKDTSRLPPCSVGVIRFIHINTGGVCSKQNFVEYKLLLTNMSIAQADIYSVNEINLDTTQKKIKKALYDIGQREIKHGHQYFSTSKETYPRAFKPDGTMLGLAPHMAAR